MSRKSKGINAERELIHMFWETKGWSGHRIAGSGSSRYPSPDIIAGNSQRRLALECKTLKEGKKYLNQKEVEQLERFSQKFGAEPWLAMKFDRQGWFFLKPENLEKTGNCLAISKELIGKKGIVFEELVKKPKDLKEEITN